MRLAAPPARWPSLLLLAMTLVAWPARAQDTPSADRSALPDQPASSRESGEAPVVVRLVITTDAPGKITVDGEELGILQPGETLTYEVATSSGAVKATSVETPTATARETFTVGDPPAGGEGHSVPEVTIKLRLAKVIRMVRKSERRDGIFPDFKSGVMWRRKDNSADSTWQSARRYCSALSFAGYSDWRLPEIDELDGLQAMWSSAAFKTLDPITLSECCPWSNSEIDEQSAWHYNFRFRKAFKGQKGFSFGLRALCVRTLTAEELQEHELQLAERKREKKDRKKQADKTVDEEDGVPPDPLDDASPPPSSL